MSVIIALKVNATSAAYMLMDCAVILYVMHIDKGYHKHDISLWYICICLIREEINPFS